MVATPMSTKGLSMIQASSGVHSANASSSKPTAWKTRSVKDLVLLMIWLPQVNVVAMITLGSDTS